MVDIGIAAHTTETSRLVVDEVSGTLAIVGAGVEGGPARRVNIFEDVKVHGNLEAGVCRAVRFHLPDGGAGTSTPRLTTEISNSELTIVGAGVDPGPNRLVKVYDNLEVSRDATVGNDASVGNDLSVGHNIQAVGDIAANNNIEAGGSIGAATSMYTRGRMTAANMVYAAGTFQIYDRGAGLVCKQCCGYGFDPLFPITFGTNISFAPLAGFPPLARVLLDTPITQCVVSIAPWFVAQYDAEAPAGEIPPIQAYNGYVSLNPYIVIKGTADPVNGAVPMTGGVAQQIEILFAVEPMGAPFIPSPGSPATDLVFDIIVAGVPAIM